jgi:hypothetical protein
MSASRPSLRTKWLSALRSGRFAQARNYLRSDDQRCCLGVLCDLWAEDHPGSWGPGNYDSEFAFTAGGESVSHMPQLFVLEAVGLSIDEATVLAARNDKGFSFAEIADIIERGDIMGESEDEVPPHA